MTWIQRLLETYDHCAGREPEGADRLMPIGHTTQQAQIEIVLDHAGGFKRASVLDKASSKTLIPCTEESGGRAGSKPVNHPLCDKLQYVAGDFVIFGGEVTSGFTADPDEPHRAYLADLRDWERSGYDHPKLKAIRRYVERGRVISDLVGCKVLPAANHKLIKAWPGEKSTAPAIFGVIQSTQSPEDAFVRWRVEQQDDPVSATWEDAALIAAWKDYYQGKQTKHGICMATGLDVALATQHPAKLRHGGDKAKLISSNDISGLTFRGRFLESDEVAAVGFVVTQKAHNSLRWLIGRQGYRNGDQMIVSWAVSGQPIPDPFKSTLDLLGIASEDLMVDVPTAFVAQTFALCLNKAIAGYGPMLDPGSDIVVMALDSATPGRMAIAFYRELKGSEFLQRVEAWHARCAWLQNLGKGRMFVGAPAPRDIAEAAYGRRLDAKLGRSTIERLLPCIIDGQSIPFDLVRATTRQASNRLGLEKWEWEKCLGIACGLLRGFHIERGYQMALELERTSRDYLYGRLLAIADHIEDRALYVAGEKRETTAARLMQRFSDRPYSAWKTIELSLSPYRTRLRAARPGFLYRLEKELDSVMCAFSRDEFKEDRQLSGEFLLGFHCQRRSLREGSAIGVEDDSSLIAAE